MDPQLRIKIQNEARCIDNLDPAIFGVKEQMNTQSNAKT